MSYTVDQIKNGKYLMSFGPFATVELAIEEIDTLKISGVGSVFSILDTDGIVVHVVDRSEEPCFIPAVCGA